MNRAVLVIGSALAAVTLLAASGTSARPSSIRLLSVTPRVAQGGVVTASAIVSPVPAACSLAMRPPSGRSPASTHRRARHRRVRWRVRIPQDAAPGRWTLTLACGKAGRARARFTVVQAIAPAPVVVEKAGFSEDTAGGGASISYGIVLINESTSADAWDVSLNVRFVDASGRALATLNPNISVIPAASRFFKAGHLFSDSPLAIASMLVRVSVHSSKPKEAVLPSVRNVAVVSAASLGLEVTGIVSNPYPKPLSSGRATIYAVVFDANGSVVGGGEQAALEQVQPAASLDFRLHVFPPSVGSSAQVSVDPCGGVTAGCAVLAR
jgi:hypothetical protein